MIVGKKYLKSEINKLLFNPYREVITLHHTMIRENQVIHSVREPKLKERRQLYPNQLSQIQRSQGQVRLPHINMLALISIPVANQLDRHTDMVMG